MDFGSIRIIRIRLNHCELLIVLIISRFLDGF